jgi:hypothetical protein
VIVQFFPWGTGSVSNLSATSGESYAAAAPGLEQASSGTWTTEAFEEQLGGRISTLATDRSFSWIVSARREHYSIPRDLAFRALTQARIAVVLVLVPTVLAPLSRMRRLAAVACMGASGTIAIHGGMMNWMGMLAAYCVGESFNLLVGWLLAFSAIDRLAMGSQTGRRAQP